jgi:hypothetical protein
VAEFCYIHGMKVVSNFFASCAVFWKNSNLIFELSVQQVLVLIYLHKC